MPAKPPTMRGKARKAEGKSANTPVSNKNHEQRAAHLAMSGLRALPKVPGCPAWQLDERMYFTLPRTSLETAISTSEVYLVTKIVDEPGRKKEVWVKRMGQGKSYMTEADTIVKPYMVSNRKKRTRKNLPYAEAPGGI